MKLTGRPPLPRAAVQALQDVAHGALDFAELERHQLTPETVIDFSTNTNPYGPPPGVFAALERAVVDRYPDREALRLRATLADHLETRTENLLAGNGSAELMWLAALAYLDVGQRVLILGPTFGEYARAAEMMGAQVDELRAMEVNGFASDVQAVAARLGEQAYRMVFVCNPNNPTGQALPPGCIQAWAQAFPETLFVVDEAYIAFAPGMASVIGAELPNVLALRSMTKDYALTGLRLGYCVGHAEIIGALRKVRPPWNVNTMAQEAGVAALEDRGHVLVSMARLWDAKSELTRALTERGYQTVSSLTHFFLMQVENGAGFRSALRANGVLVRDCASFGLPAYVRIAARKPEENEGLLRAIDEVRA